MGNVCRHSQHAANVVVQEEALNEAVYGQGVQEEAADESTSCTCSCKTSASGNVQASAEVVYAKGTRTRTHVQRSPECDRETKKHDV
jgi:hypothetical protein